MPPTLSVPATRDPCGLPRTASSPARPDRHWLRGDIRTLGRCISDIPCRRRHTGWVCGSDSAQTLTLADRLFPRRAPYVAPLDQVSRGINAPVLILPLRSSPRLLCAGYNLGLWQNDGEDYPSRTTRTQNAGGCAGSPGQCPGCVRRSAKPTGTITPSRSICLWRIGDDAEPRQVTRGGDSESARAGRPMANGWRSCAAATTQAAISTKRTNPNSRSGCCRWTGWAAKPKN